MADREAIFGIDEEAEIFDQIVPDQDDCFLPPNEVALSSGPWPSTHQHGVSIIFKELFILFLKIY